MNVPSMSRRRLGALVCVWAVLGGGALVVSACYGRNCEGLPRTFGLDAGEGQLVDQNTWESSTFEGDWLPFPRQASYSITLPFGGRSPYDVHMFVSAQRRPSTDPGGNATTGAGNLTEQLGWGPNHVSAINDTCSDYYLRVVAYAPPFAAADAGSAQSTPSTTTAADSGASDAASDGAIQ